MGDRFWMSSTRGPYIGDVCSADSLEISESEFHLENEKRNNDNNQKEILFRLSEIDTLAIRPLRATITGTQTKADTDKLLSLELEASELRAQLKG